MEYSLHFYRSPKPVYLYQHIADMLIAIDVKMVFATKIAGKNKYYLCDYYDHSITMKVFPHCYSNSALILDRNDKLLIGSLRLKFGISGRQEPVGVNAGVPSKRRIWHIWLPIT